MYKNKGTSLWKFIANFGLREFRHGRSIVFSQKNSSTVKFVGHTYDGRPRRRGWKVDVLYSPRTTVVMATELLQPRDLACGTLFQSSCVILTSPMDCSDDSWRDTFFEKREHCALWLLICGAIEKHLLTYVVCYTFVDRTALLHCFDFLWICCATCSYSNAMQQLTRFNSWPTFSPYLYNRVWSELTCCNSLSHSRRACSRLSAYIQPSVNNPRRQTRPIHGHELS